MVEVVLVSLVFGLVYRGVSLVLRIPELPSIVGVMADVLRRPRQVVTAVDPTSLGRVRRGERPRLVPAAARVGLGQGGQRLDRRTASLAGPGAGARSARRSSSAGRDRCRGPSPTPRAGRSPATGRRDAIGAFTAAVRDGLPGAAGRISHLRIDPEIERDGPLDPDGALRRALRGAGWRPAPPIQPNATRIIDLRPDEEALWGDLRKKWRQYVNKARTAGITVVDADGDRLGEFYRIYRETADRAGFLIRAEVGLPRRVGGVRAERPRPAPVRADRRRRAARDAVPRAVPGRGSSSRTAG